MRDKDQHQPDLNRQIHLAGRGRAAPPLRSGGGGGPPAPTPPATERPDDFEVAERARNSVLVEAAKRAGMRHAEDAPRVVEGALTYDGSAAAADALVAQFRKSRPALFGPEPSPPGRIAMDTLIRRGLGRDRPTLGGGESAPRPPGPGSIDQGARGGDVVAEADAADVNDWLRRKYEEGRG